MSTFDISGLVKKQNPGFGSVGDITSAALKYVFYIAGTALLIYLVTGGLSLMTSTGDPKKVEAAKQTITNAIIGIFVIIFSALTVQLLGTILGIDILKNLFKF